MMTPEDGFDARLSAAFDRADAEITPDESFTRHVETRLGLALNPRTMVLGGAGASGSALAASQMERLADGLQFDNALLTQFFDLVGTQSIVAVVFALVAATFIYVLPSRRV